MKEQEFKVKPPVDKNNPTHYIDNVAFFQSLKDYKVQVDAALAEGKERPIVPNYIGECFQKIARGIAMKYNFRNYSYLADMESTAVETCLKNMLSFNPEKSANPFGYFTQVVWYAFLGVIAKEKKQSEIKRKMFFDLDPATFDVGDMDNADEFRISLVEYIQSLGTDKEKKVAKTFIPTSIDLLFDED